MLDYLTSTNREFIKNILVAKSGQDDLKITRILDVKKTSGVVSEKEIWPNQPTKLRIFSNYDMASNVKQRPDCAYSAPVINPASNVFVPIQIMVVPYPEDAKWKLTHSSNFVHDSVFDEIYAGTKTVTVPFATTIAPGSEEFCWISAVPASNDALPYEAKFAFWAKEPMSSGVVEEEADTSGAIISWSFEQEHPLLDSVRGISLDTYKNPTPASAHLSDENTGVNGCCLRSIYYEEQVMILVDNQRYARQTSINLPTNTYAIYGWYNSTLEKAYYTTAETPSVGAALYNADDSDSGKTVADIFTTESNKWTTNTGIDFTDTDKAYTLIGYAHPYEQVRFGFSNSKLEFECSTSRWGLNYNGSLRLNDQNTSYNKLQLSNEGWIAFVGTLTKRYSVETDIYTPAKGYGFTLHQAAYLKIGNNSACMCYERDITNDSNGRYAWTWKYYNGKMGSQPTSIPLLDGEVQYPSTFWTDTDELVAGNNKVRATATGDIIEGMYFGVTDLWLEYNDNRYLIDSEPLHWERWNTNNNTNPPSKYGNGGRLVLVYVQGRLRGGTVQFNNAESGHDGSFYISVPTTKNTIVAGSKNFSGVDEIKVYERELSEAEIVVHAGDIGVGGDLDDLKAVKIKADYQTAHGAKKITIQDGSTYYYDPDLTVTVRDPVSVGTDTYVSIVYFGWQKLSGNGPEHVYTDTLDVATGSLYRLTANPNDELDLSKKLTDVVLLNINDAVIKCPLVVRVIDNKTIAVSIMTHDAIVNKMRVMFPDIEAITYNSSHRFIVSYDLGFTQNCAIWRTHNTYQPEIKKRADNSTLWKIDGNDVTVSNRFWTSLGLFYVNQIQYRNCGPDNPNYATKCDFAGDAAACDYTHVAYLTLSEPMQEGTTHTVTWCGNSATFEYSPNQYCATIKVNQEGYLPWASKKYAYVGRWMCGTSYEIEDPTHTNFYLVPASNPDAAHAVFTSTMTQRCIAGSNNGVCKDKYGLGTYPNHPLTGENVYQLDFSGFTSVEKACITTDNGVYDRDELNDFTAGTITVEGTVYTRDDSKDTCNAYAWYNASATPKIMYTEPHIPVALTDIAREEYDDFEHIHDITNVVTQQMYAWSTMMSRNQDEEPFAYLERVWKYRSTVWTTNEIPSAGEHALNRDGSINDSILNINTETTEDITGLYQIYVPGMGWSHKFPIGQESMGHQWYIHMRGLFHQRSGCAQVRHPYTNWEYYGPGHAYVYDGGFVYGGGNASDTNLCWEVNPVTHEEILTEEGARVQLSGSGTAFGMNDDQDKLPTQPMYDVYGGWFDAADFDMREMHIDIIGELANAYIRNPDGLTDNQLDLPESGDGIPDILSEAIWGAELYRKAQTEKGGIRGWFEAKQHESDWPWLSTLKYYACSPSMNHSLRYALSAARLARALKIAATKTDDPAVKKRCLNMVNMYTESACAAFEYGVKDQYAPYLNIPQDQREIVYIRCKNRTWAYLEWYDVFSDGTINGNLKEFGIYEYNAACALYVLTHEERYAKYITKNITQKMVTGWGESTNDCSRYAPYEMALDLYDEFPDQSILIRNKAVSKANEWINRLESHPYRILTWKPGEANMKFQGLGTAHPELRGDFLMMAYLVTGDTYYRDELILAFDQITGCNGLGMCWTTGMGKVSVGRHLDHWVARNAIWNDIWTPRPGISTYRFDTPYWMLYKASDKTINCAYEGRADHGCPRVQFSMVPALWTQSHGMTMSNAKDIQAQTVPFWSWEPIYECEGINVGASEYTIWETISHKCFLTACMIGPGWKPRASYKQAAPKKGFMNNAECLAMLP